jgi:hypothetical protein
MQAVTNQSMRTSRYLVCDLTSAEIYLPFQVPSPASIRVLRPLCTSTQRRMPPQEAKTWQWHLLAGQQNLEMLVSRLPFLSLMPWSRLGANSITVQGVDYSASIGGSSEGADSMGSQTIQFRFVSISPLDSGPWFVMETLIKNTLNLCPNTKLVMSGYSQGANSSITQLKYCQPAP